MYDNEPNEALVVQTHPKPIHAIPMAEAVKMGDQGGTTAPRKSGCRDPFFAALFLANLGIMIYFAAAHGVSGLSVDNNDSSTLSSILGDVSLGTMLGAAAVVILFAAVLCWGWLKWTMRDAEGMLQLSFKVYIGMYGLAAVAALAFGNIFMAIICCLGAVLTFCFWRMVQDRLPFAAANLTVSCAALKAHPSTGCIVLGSMVASVVWVILWVLALVGIDRVSSNGLSFLPAFGLLVSFYWGGMVCKNVSHVTISGAVGSWWFHPPDQQDSGTVCNAFARATTSSFGSIAFGSLLVAILEAIRAVLRSMMRQTRNPIMMCVVCCTQCLLRYVEMLLQFINRYAFVYVAIYGDDFVTAGRKVKEMFEARGFWVTVVNDIVLDRCLSLGLVAIALLSGVAGYGMGIAVGSGSAAVTLAVFGALVGLLMASVSIGAVESGVACVYVAFGEEPGALRENHPGEFELLYSGWNHLYPQIVNGMCTGVMA